ncbi:MAG: adenylosuccinate lyase [Phycisphaeraceae bacterium]|nr:adenylosuccinate lyase [Phycisphaeraceae bacterium]
MSETDAADRPLDRYDAYENPLAGRYASVAMKRVFSARFRFSTWRRLWLALAEGEQDLGIPISDPQLEEIRDNLDTIDFERAAALEKELRHDVMAHIYAFREQCPEAGKILHLGATSCFVTDNSEVVQVRTGLELVLRKVRVVLRNLREFCLEWKDLPTVGYTHFQPAQFTTVGKRAALWLQDLLEDHRDLSHALAGLKFRGVKGTTGTQDSFLKLFDGDHGKVLALDRAVAEKMGFDAVWPLTGQTYTRKQDSRVLAALSGLAQSAGKLSSDIRLLCNLQEVEEPFGKKQIGSSAMAYKRNPMRSERIAALSRWLISLAQNAPSTTAAQWMERTLDDSANRRLTLGEGFLCADAILELLMNVTSGLVVQEAVVNRHVREQLPFIASEELLMAAVKDGGDRQDLHDVIRTAALDASQQLKAQGGDNTFFERIADHPRLGPALKRLDRDPGRFVGRAPQQVTEFVANELDPELAGHPEETMADEIAV